MLKVLIVDDEEIVLEGLHRLLNKISGISVVQKLHDGASAKTYLENNYVDLIFSDIRMPIMDGIALASWVYENKPDCKIVFVSAYNDFSYAQQAMRYGVKYYLSKPIRQYDVNKIIEQILEDQKMLQHRSLWNRDLQQEAQEKQLYDLFVLGTIKQQNSKFLYSEYYIQIDSNDIVAYGLKDDLITAGLTNIFRWSAPQCTCILTDKQQEQFVFTIITQDEAYLPNTDDLQRRIQELMNVHAFVSYNGARDALLLHGKNTKQDDETCKDNIIAAAKAFISANLSQNISRNDVAKAVHLEPSYFSKYFKKKTGISFHDYLQNERINKAKELLKAGSKVQDAAREAGFFNRNYFNQVFKQYTGCAPSQFKEREMRN